MNEDYSGYRPPRGPKTPEDMEWVADCVTRQLKSRLDKFQDNYAFKTLYFLNKILLIYHTLKN